MKTNKKFSKSGDLNSSPYGDDKFGILAEKFARFFGTPKFIVIQSIFVLMWIAGNLILLEGAWDPYPFILLNLAFSLQAAYAAPLILLAQTRQAEREVRRERAEIEHREKLDKALDQRTGEIHRLLSDVHQVVMELDQVVEEMHNYNVREDVWRGQHDNDY